MYNSTMRWRIILPPALVFGLAMGMSAVMGWTGPIAGTAVPLEPFLWLIIAITCSFIIGTRVPRLRLLHGLVLGVLLGTINSMCAFALYPIYLDHNPHLAARFTSDAPLPPRVFMLVTGPIIGSFYGVFVGVLASLAGKIADRRRAAPAGGP